MTGDGIIIACSLVAELLCRLTLTGRTFLNLQALGDSIEQFRPLSRKLQQQLKNIPRDLEHS